MKLEILFQKSIEKASKFEDIRQRIVGGRDRGAVTFMLMKEWTMILILTAFIIIHPQPIYISITRQYTSWTVVHSRFSSHCSRFYGTKRSNWIKWNVCFTSRGKSFREIKCRTNLWVCWKCLVSSSMLVYAWLLMHLHLHLFYFCVNRRATEAHTNCFTYNSIRNVTFMHNFKHFRSLFHVTTSSNFFCVARIALYCMYNFLRIYFYVHFSLHFFPPVWWHITIVVIIKSIKRRLTVASELKVYANFQFENCTY